MTNNEAIEQLKSILETSVADADVLLYTEDYEAIDYAIQALDQESILDKIKAEVKEWYWKADKQALAKDPCVVDAMVDLFIRTIDKYKAESEGI